LKPEALAAHAAAHGAAARGRTTEDLFQWLTANPFVPLLSSLPVLCCSAR
jgi:hypothetical protein